MDKKQLLRNIPGVDRILESPALSFMLEKTPRSIALKAINSVLDGIRASILNGKLSSEEELDIENVSNRVIDEIKTLSRHSLRGVINATGVIVHTNLGRSILPKQAIRRFKLIAGGYSNLEYDLGKGKRGSRYSHVEELLKELTGAEGAMVVNNNAAAVLLCLDTLAKGQEVIVSRGELVEIGGSFRIPDVMKKSGARMIEVGTTNKTHLKDYVNAISPDTALLLKVHRSNFQILGFTKDVSEKELVELGREHRIPVMEDLGSGCFVDFSKYGLDREPTVQEVLSYGVDVVTFSGDKILGGPQAGIILGRGDIIDEIKKNQLSRALRIDKLTLYSLEDTLRLYRDEEIAIKEIPTLRMILMQPAELKRKAKRLIKMIGPLEGNNFNIELKEGISRVGGGALPLLDLPTTLVAMIPVGLSASNMEEWFRDYEPPIIVRVEKEQILIDVRTVQDGELKILADAIKRLADIELKS